VDADGSFVLERLARSSARERSCGSPRMTAGTRLRLSATLDAARLDLGDCYRTGDVEPAAAARRPGLFGRAAALRCAQTADSRSPLTARQLVVGAAILDDFAVDLALQKVAACGKVTGTFRGGPFSTTAIVDARPATPLVTLLPACRNSTSPFLEEMAVTDLLTGAVDLDLDARSAGGRSARSCRARRQVVMVMGKAELATPLFDLIGATSSSPLCPGPHTTATPT